MANNTIPPLGAAVTVVYYRDYYGTTDPFNGNFLAALEPYHIPFNHFNILQPVVVKQMACDARQHRIPTAFILLGKRDLKLHVYCQLTKFSARYGLPASEWDNRMFIHKGELYNNQGVLVDTFHQASQVRVPSVQAIEEAYSDPQTNILGPFTPSDDDTVLIRTRRTCYVPLVYVPLFLTQPLTPREAWDTVVQPILTDQRQ